MYAAKLIRFLRLLRAKNSSPAFVPGAGAWMPHASSISPMRRGMCHSEKLVLRLSLTPNPIVVSISNKSVGKLFGFPTAPGEHEVAEAAPPRAGDVYVLANWGVRKGDGGEENSVKDELDEARRAGPPPPLFSVSFVSAFRFSARNFRRDSSVFSSACSANDLDCRKSLCSRSFALSVNCSSRLLGAPVSSRLLSSSMNFIFDRMCSRVLVLSSS
mmetsp:Transcript_6993/g.11621  ORF Transcript_6993/g.11621 Transcript_6993/m.11621 type:complete len:215 (-) Transcript_6993:105-749(-)